MQTIRSGALATILAFCVLGSASSAIASPQIQPGKRLTLEEAIEITLENHPRALAARSQAASAAEGIDVARS
ncbi:MAG: hypothetical protein LAN63_17415, partial [Acidobacteriia bacterium]|nr:hypothetical protein [Terriglobia bacterium]